MTSAAERTAVVEFHCVDHQWDPFDGDHWLDQGVEDPPAHPCVHVAEEAEAES